MILWNGMYLSESGDYTYTLLNSVGCDSIAYINFIINITGLHNMNINKSKILIKVVDVLGREINNFNQSPIFNIYNDGRVEKVIILD